MINLAVIEIKDVIKYLVRITIVIAIVVGLTRYFFSMKTENVNSKINSDALLYCLDTVIPNIKEIHKKDKVISKNEKKIEPLKMTLGVELGMINHLTKKEDTKDNNTDQNNNTTNEQVANQLTEELEEAKVGVKTEVLETNVPEKFTDTYKKVKIRNETDIKLTEETLTPNVEMNMKDIYIYHTHACESYTQSKKYKYEASGNFRTLNKERSVIRVGTELEKYMTEYGYNVTHDMTLFDYPSYNDSYDRSYDSVSKFLKDNEETEIFLDIHRDAIGDSTYAPTVKIGDEYAAQLMFVLGSEGGGNEHPNWKDNLKLAIKIQEKAEEMYPGLFKPIILRNSRYNQQLARGASIIEVGATGNTLDQCLVSMKYLSKVLSEALK